jgi:hypothetical protein
LFVGNAFNAPGGLIPTSRYAGDNVMVGKIDSSHNVSWVKIYGGNAVDVGYSACQTPDGGYAVLAYTESHDGNITGSKGGGDIWLMKLDGSGNLLWQKCYGSTWEDYPISIDNTPDGGFIILGWSLGSGRDIPFHYGSNMSTDWVVIKTDNAGNLQWCKNLGGTDDEAGVGAILSIDSAYYLVSSSFSKDHDCVDTAWHAGRNTNGDLYVLKLASDGNVLWGKSYGGSQNDYVLSALYDNRDSTIVTNGGTGSSDYMVTGYSGGASDMWVVKLNKRGSLIWQKPLGNTMQTIGTGICLAHDGGYLACGYTYLPPNGDDGWIFELDNSGNIVTDKIFGGGGGDHPASVLPYLHGYVVAGETGSLLFTEGICDSNNSGAFVSYIDSVPVSAVKNISVAQRLDIFPSPAFQHVTISLPGHDMGKLIIVNNMGQRMYEQSIERSINPVVLDVSQWVAGLYFIEWLGENGTTVTKKLIKN